VHIRAITGAKTELYRDQKDEGNDANV